jgi:hypothetical protein
MKVLLIIGCIFAAASAKVAGLELDLRKNLIYARFDDFFIENLVI